MTALKEKNEELFKLLAEYYEGYGMKADLKHATFSDETRQVYWYPYHKDAKKIIYIPSITFRFPEIQNLQNLLTPAHYNLTVNRDTNKRLADELLLEKNGYQFNENQMFDSGAIWYAIDNTENTSAIEVFQNHKSYMENIGFHLFAKLNTVDKIHQFINEDLLSVQLDSLSKKEIKVLKKKSLNQEVIAGVIASFLTSNDLGNKVSEVRKNLHHINKNLVSEINKIQTYFNNKSSLT